MGKTWKQAEIDILLSLVSHVPISDVTHAINEWNISNNTGIARSAKKVRERAVFLGYKERPNRCKKTPRWSKEELEYLLDKAGELPVDIITRRLNRWHKSHQRKIKRTRQAVKSKLRRLGYPSLPTFDCLRYSHWEKELNVSQGSMNNWERRGHVCPTFSTHNYRFLSIKDMENFMKRKPYLFKKAPDDIIEYYFGREMVDLVKQSKSPREPRPIMRTDNGQVFPSINQASKSLKLAPLTIITEANRENGWLRYAG
jgi:hypothetical protein